MKSSIKNMVTRKTIFETLREKGTFPLSSEFCEKVTELLIKEFEIEKETLSEEELKVLKSISTDIQRKTREFIKQIGKNYDYILTKKASWFDQKIENPFKKRKLMPKSTGRPEKPFNEKSRTQQYKVASEISKSHETGALIKAASISASREGESDSANVLRRLSSDPVTEGSKIRKALNSKVIEIIPYTNLEALALIIRLHFTKDQYQHLRKGSKQRNACLYPAYNYVVKTKKLCQPQNIQFFEDEAKVSMQSTLNHQISKILSLKSVQEKLQPLLESYSDLKASLYVKYGADGSTNHSQYQFMDACGQNAMFVSALAPIQIIITLPNNERVQIYENKMHNSPYGMCPLRYKFEKETTENSVLEGERLENEATSLVPHICENSGLVINFETIPSMGDNKVKFTWSATTLSMNNCFICGATPVQMAQRFGNFIADLRALCFGFSNLHTKIRIFEWICKGGMYRDFCEWQARGPNKIKFQQRKEELIQEFKEKLGLIVYHPKKLNNGNVARKAFENPDIFSEITHVPVGLIKGIKAMIEAIDSTVPVNPDKFKQFADNWLDEFHASTISWNWPRSISCTLFY